MTNERAHFAHSTIAKNVPRAVTKRSSTRATAASNGPVRGVPARPPAPSPRAGPCERHEQASDRAHVEFGHDADGRANHHEQAGLQHRPMANSVSRRQLV
jgi:hypothetical protein